MSARAGDYRAEIETAVAFVDKNLTDHGIVDPEAGDRQSGP